MDGGMFDGFGKLLRAMLWVLAISVPLGVWKAIEIIIWALRHVHVA